MSHQGKLIRGLKWYSQRDVHGELPLGITSDPEKMKDVNYYLEFAKDKDERRLNEHLMLVRNLGRGKKGRSEYREAVLKLNNFPTDSKEVNKKKVK